MSTIITIVLYLIVGYLVGSIFISYPWGLLRGIDITKAGTGQLGGSNAGRLLGWYVLFIAGLFDILKSFLTLLLFNYLNIYVFSEGQLTNELSMIAGGVGILLGHIYSIYISLYSKKWQGGKGAAPFGGIILFISWQSFIIIYPVIFGLLKLGRKLLNRESALYDNFLNNAVLLLLSPIVVYFFRPELWITAWLLCLILLLLVIERKKVLDLLRHATRISYL